jgi:hypothetical protein
MNEHMKQPTLNQVAEAFKIWRDAKTSRREKIPPYLWELVRTIAPLYPRRKIEVALSITKEQLDREAPASELSGLSDAPGLTQTSKTGFIELSMAEFPSMGLESPLRAALTITRDDGSSWMLSATNQAVISESLRLFLRS